MAREKKSLWQDLYNDVDVRDIATDVAVLGGGLLATSWLTGPGGAFAKRQIARGLPFGKRGMFNTVRRARHWRAAQESSQTSARSAYDTLRHRAVSSGHTTPEVFRRVHGDRPGPLKGPRNRLVGMFEYSHGAMTNEMKSRRSPRIRNAHMSLYARWPHYPRRTGKKGPKL